MTTHRQLLLHHLILVLGLFLCTSTPYSQNKIDSLKEKAAQLLGEADTLSASGKLAAARKLYEKSGAIYRSLQDSANQSDILESLGSLAEKEGNYEQSLKLHQQSLALRRALGDPERIGMSLSQIGLLYQSLHRYEKAQPVLEEALEYAVQIKSPEGEAATTELLGLNASYLGEDSVAIGYQRKALHLFGKTNNDEGIQNSLMSLGFAFKNLQQFDSAGIYYDKALAVATSRHDKEIRGEILGNTSKVMVALGRYDSAVVCADSALRIARELSIKVDEGVALAQLGLAWLSQGQPDKALSSLQQSLAIFKKLGVNEREAVVRHRIMLAWKAKGKPNTAIIQGKRAVNIYQTIRRRIKSLGRDILADYTRSKADTYRILADLLLEQGRMSEAFDVMHMLKEDEYFEFVRGEPGSSTHTAELTPSETSWEREYNKVSSRIISKGLEYQRLREKKQLTDKEEQRRIELESAIELANRSLNALIEKLEARRTVKPQQAVKLEELKNLYSVLSEPLRKLQAVAIYTIVTPDKYIVVLVTPEVAKPAEYQISAKELRKKILAFREVLDDPGADPVPMASELYTILVGPIKNDLRQSHATTIMWSLDDALRYVPINALYDGKEYLIETYQNTLSTSATVSHLNDPSTHKWRGLGMGVSKPLGNFSALPSVPEELQSIIKTDKDDTTGTFPGVIMLNEKFTESAMRSSLQNKFSLVHVASHFRFSPGDETKSFLLLGDGKELTLDRIKNAPGMFRGVDLLTLSACNTAAYGSDADGKEVEGFGELAQRQSARSVIVSLWPIVDSSTAILMAKFYKLTKETTGVSKGQALRQAQLSLLRGNYIATSSFASNTRGDDQHHASGGSSFSYDPAKPFAHPHYWAPFVMIGNWR